MDKHIDELQIPVPGTNEAQRTDKGRHDLKVLSSIAQQVCLALHTMEQPEGAEPPVLYALSMKQRYLRIALYNVPELWRRQQLAFVGFVSGRQTAAPPHIVEEIHRTDAKLVQALSGISGLLAYASLELRAGAWYNLVVLNGADVRSQLKGLPIHSYASQMLAPQYYEWIRLHMGRMPDGLASKMLVLEKTKHYTFQQSGQTFHMQERMY